MKLITCLVFFLTVVSYSQTEKQLIEDNCKCINKVDEKIKKDEKVKLIMDCSLQAFKQNRSYTEMAVKEFTGKKSIEGSDILDYQTDVFNDIMADNCVKYRNLLADIYGTQPKNRIIEKIGLEVCKNLPREFSEAELITLYESITDKNYNEISNTYTKENEQDYVSDLKEYLVNNCGKYRQHVLKHGGGKP